MSELAFQRQGHPKTAVLWVALGTPAEPTPQAVRIYLREFLTDRRIVEMPPVLWRVILEAFILRFRPKASAAKYRTIWTAAGSPLLYHTKAQAAALQQGLAERGLRVEVAFAMRYGSPSIASVLDRLKADGVTRVLIVPAYPQYSQTTVGSTFDAVARYVLDSRDQLELRLLRSWPTDSGYIEALAARCEEYWRQSGRPDFDAGDVLLVSFHGIPLSMSQAGDPYRNECLATATRLRRRLGLDEAQCRVTFQSKFGPSQWLTPATIDTVRELGAAGVHRVDVVCPSFVADCLESLEEIGIENRAAFATATGGQGEFGVVECVNEHPAFMAGLADRVAAQLQGWVSGRFIDQLRSRAVS